MLSTKWAYKKKDYSGIPRHFYYSSYLTIATEEGQSPHINDNPYEI